MREVLFCNIDIRLQQCDKRDHVIFMYSHMYFHKLKELCLFVLFSLCIIIKKTNLTSTIFFQPVVSTANTGPHRVAQETGSDTFLCITAQL